MEIAIHHSSEVMTHGTATASFESSWTVVRNITPSTSSQITVSSLDIIVLPGTSADRVWKGNFKGRDRVFISRENVNFVMANENEIHLRANTSQYDETGTMAVNVSILPFSCQDTRRCKCNSEFRWNVYTFTCACTNSTASSCELDVAKRVQFCASTGECIFKKDPRAHV